MEAVMKPCFSGTRDLNLALDRKPLNLNLNLAEESPNSTKVLLPRINGRLLLLLILKDGRADTWGLSVVGDVYISSCFYKCS
ncbi:hypothetical protein Bca101_020277 [Brassica carinata]